MEYCIRENSDVNGIERTATAYTKNLLIKVFYPHSYHGYDRYSTLPLLNSACFFAAHLDLRSKQEQDLRRKQEAFEFFATSS